MPHLVLYSIKEDDFEGSHGSYLASPQIILTPSSTTTIPSTTTTMPSTTTNDDVDMMMADTEVFTNGYPSPTPDEEIFTRVTALEEKARLQDVEITLLKSALSDVLTKLAAQEHAEGLSNDSSANKSPIKSKVNKDNTRRLNGRSLSSHSFKANKTTTSNTKDINNINNTINSRQRALSYSSGPRSSPHSPNTTTPLKKKSITSTKINALSTTNNNIFNKKLLDNIDDGDKHDGFGQDDTPKEKPRLILAPKRQNSRSGKRSNSGSNSDDGKENQIDEAVKFYIRGRGIRLYRPTEFKDAQPDGRAPEETLKLDWVYGYRGKDCRDNLFLLPATGELVYNMAGVVVFYDYATNKQRHYTEHNDDVKCISLHPNNVLLASGQIAGHGAKPHVRVWDTNTMETKVVFGQGVFERGLCALAFSQKTGKYLVCIDESNDHVAYLYDWEKGVKLTEANVSKEAIFSAKWQPNCEDAFITYGRNHIVFWKIQCEGTSTQMTRKVGVFDKVPRPKYVLCTVFSPSNDVVIGDSNGTISFFREASTKVSNAQVEAHKGGVFSLICVPNKLQYISGGKDNTFICWSENLECLQTLGTISEQYGPSRCCLYDVTRDLFLIGTNKNCIIQTNADWSEEKVLIQGHSDEMWGLATHPTQPIFATCSQENLVCVWDGKKQELLWSYFIEDGAQCTDLHSREPFVLVGTKIGTLYILNYETKEELVTLPVSRDCLDDVKVSPDCKYVAVACRDSNIYLYNWPKEVVSFKKPKALQGHSSRVLHLDWSIDGEFFQSNSGDYEVLFWHAESGCQVLTPAALRDVQWFTYTCPFGFPVMGVWPEGADGTDINACSRSNNKTLVATGDDFGAVNLFKFPSIKLKSDCRTGVGHSSHVTCVRFLHDDSSLITVGGADSSVMQWKLLK